jgi:hypothetical protein
MDATNDEAAKLKKKQETDWTPALERLLVELYTQQIRALDNSAPDNGAPDNGQLQTQGWTKLHWSS